MGVRPAAAARGDLRDRVARAGGLNASGLSAGRARGAGRSGGGFRAGRGAEGLRLRAAAGDRCGRKAETRRGGHRQEHPAGPPDAGRPGPGAGGAGRPGAPARRRPLRVEGGHRRRLPARDGDGAGRAASRCRYSDAGADAATDTELRACAELAGSDRAPGRCREEAGRPRYSDGEAARFGPRHSGGGETTGLAAGRGPLPLRRSTDWTPLQLTTYDRDRPHPAICAGRRRRSWKPQIAVPSPPPPSARAAWLTAHS